MFDFQMSVYKGVLYPISIFIRLSAQIYLFCRASNLQIALIKHNLAVTEWGENLEAEIVYRLTRLQRLTFMAKEADLLCLHVHLQFTAQRSHTQRGPGTH